MGLGSYLADYRRIRKQRGGVLAPNCRRANRRQIREDVAILLPQARDHGHHPFHKLAAIGARQTKAPLAP